MMLTVIVFSGRVKKSNFNLIGLAQGEVHLRPVQLIDQYRIGIFTFTLIDN